MDYKEEILLEGEVNVTKITNKAGKVSYAVRFGVAPLHGGVTDEPYGDYHVHYAPNGSKLSIDPHVKHGVNVWCRDSAGIAITPMPTRAEDCYIRTFPGGQKPDDQEWY